MTIEQLRTAHHAQPFRPYRDDSFSVIDLLLVTELEVHSASQGQPQTP
jgi:hypothetical protein